MREKKLINAMSLVWNKEIIISQLTFPVFHFLQRLRNV